MGTLFIYWILETIFVSACLSTQSNVTSQAWFLLGRLIEITSTMVLMSYYQNCLYRSGSEFDRILSHYKLWYISLPLVLPLPSYMFLTLLGSGSIPETIQVAFSIGPVVRAILKGGYVQYPFWKIGGSYQLYLIWLHHRMYSMIDFNLWWEQQHFWIGCSFCNWVPKPEQDYGHIQQEYGIPDVIWNRFIQKVAQPEGVIAV